jgi:flagellar secretion chaperone FliS
MTALAKYRKTQSETASKERLMVLLFEKALRDLRGGCELLEAKRPGEAVYALTRASDVVQYLRGSLEETVSPLLVSRLRDLYGFVAARATLAAVRRDLKLAREAERIFAPLVSAFAEAVAVQDARP